MIFLKLLKYISDYYNEVSANSSLCPREQDELGP